MVKLGNYEVVGELSLTGNGSVCRCRRRGSPDRQFIVKRYAVGVDDPAEPRWKLQSFLDRGRLQQQLGEQSTAWEQVHDLGLEDQEAWYVADYIPLTAQKLIEGRVPLLSDELYVIVHGIVAGLRDIHRLKQRSHGNLKPSNVLIEGKDLATAKVFLCDPASNQAAARVSQEDELFTLGEMIHLLALRRPFDELRWPLAASEEWDDLGSNGDRWRRLCSDLLNPEPDPRRALTLKSLDRRLKALRPRKKFPVGTLAAVLATPLVLGAVYVATLSALDHFERVAYASQSHAWFGKFLKAASDPHRRERWDADQDLHDLLAPVDWVSVRRVDPDTHRLLRWDLNDYLAVHRANEAARKLKAELPFHLTKAQHAMEWRNRMDARAWYQPGWYLSKLIENVTPEDGVDVAGGIDRLLRVSPAIERGPAISDAAWKQFVDRVHRIESSRDAVLTALAQALYKSATTEARLTDDGYVGLDDVRQDAAQAQKLGDAMASTWPVNLDKENFDRDVARLIDVRRAGKQDVNTWLALVDAHTFRPRESVAAADDLRKRLDDIVELIDPRRVPPDELEPYEKARLAASAAIERFAQAPVTQQMLADGSFERRRNDVRDAIEGLRKFHHQIEPSVWANDLLPLNASSAQINALWDHWRKTQAQGVDELAADERLFARRQRDTEQLRALLLGLDKGFPPSPPFPNELFDVAAKARREREIARILGQVDLKAPKLDATAVSAMQESYGQWVANLVALSRDFPITREIVGAGDRPDLAWQQKHPEFWADPAIAALVRADVARLRAVAALDQAPRATLVATMTAAKEAEIALAAWRRLGDAAIDPPWPSTSDELTLEFKFRRRLNAALASLKDPVEGDGPRRELAQQAPIRWRRFVQAATSEAMLAHAWKLRADFTPDASEIAKLPALWRYDLYLAALRLALDGGDEGDIHAALAGLAGAAGDLTDRPDAADLSQRIARVDQPEPFADKNPGNVFLLTLPGSGGSAQFVRVEPHAARPFYLCTSAVSVRQFAAVMDADDGWTVARRLPWPYEHGAPDRRPGPRAWQWTGTTIAPPLAWLTPPEANDFAPSLRLAPFNRKALRDGAGGPPSPDHPMNYLSAQAALYFAAACQCRLPTPDEWQAAYAAFEKTESLDHWNLRDQTWELQRQYLSTQNTSRWPDDGIFPASAGQSLIGRNATFRSSNDGILYFQSAKVGGGAVFHHLVGNVSQYCCSAADAFDQWPDRKTAAGIAHFAQAWAKSFAIIGGSALSPPEVPFDRPQPLARTDDAWADVGLRLAFTAPARSLAEKIKWTVGNPPFIWPQGPTTRGNFPAK